QHPAESVSELVFEGDALKAFESQITGAERAAITEAAQRIRRYHEEQITPDWSITDEHGSQLGQRVRPMQRVGLYVPGGKASYPSSVLMNTIPAKVAGVADVVMVAPTPSGQVNPLVLAAASLAGVDQVVTVGGAQAVAALAYGTESIRAVDKIVGPGNRYVAEAKRQVFGKVGIDMIAGPSEIFVIADGTVDPDWIALDLMSQAEHDEMAQAVCIATSEDYLDAVTESLEKLLPDMPRRDVIAASLRNRGALISVADLSAAASLSNRFAPEHLELAVASPKALLPAISSAGAVFLGAYSSESLGDYCAGTNHVLPTSGAARFSSPLSVYDFQTRTSIINITRSGANALAEVAGTIADSESLSAHARAARARKD
ncbi:MAG: histidinol dehydrogenase, partial [Pseudomonadota bacterium]|nr:histidinol dehydrogenase [Pseudomonadota bacterium]